MRRRAQRIKAVGIGTSPFCPFGLLSRRRGAITALSSSDIGSDLFRTAPVTGLLLEPFNRPPLGLNSSAQLRPALKLQLQALFPQLGLIALGLAPRSVLAKAHHNLAEATFDSRMMGISPAGLETGAVTGLNLQSELAGRDVIVAAAVDLKAASLSRQLLLGRLMRLAPHSLLNGDCEGFIVDHDLKGSAEPGTLLTRPQFEAPRIERS